MSHGKVKKDISLIMSELIQGNDKFVESTAKEYFDKIRDSQNPDITLVTCSDSRVQVNIFGGDATNRIFTIRNIGNQILPVFGSVDYGVFHLGTPLLLILGHTHCGALKAALGGYDSETADIIKELDHLAMPVRNLKHSKEKAEELWMEAAESNVGFQVKLAVKKYKPIIDAGKLTVAGAVEDFIDMYGKGAGRVVITNLNGESDPKKIIKHKSLKLVNDAVKSHAILK